VTVVLPFVFGSSSAQETRDLAGRLAPLLVAGDLILLGGDLGAGKTTFTQGLARGLGIDEQVTSPSFTLVQSYQGGGRLPLLHADVYRLEHLQEIIDLGLPELLDEGAAAVVEWGDLAAPVLLPDYLGIRIEFGQTDEQRSVQFQPVGGRWGARRNALIAAAAASLGSIGSSMSPGQGPR
jgi:tRNA threonylcarbamoyladenosine biosynthesis protein TsaE